MLQKGAGQLGPAKDVFAEGVVWIGDCGHSKLIPESCRRNKQGLALKRAPGQAAFLCPHNAVTLAEDRTPLPGMPEATLGTIK